MALLEILFHPGCLSAQLALDLIRELRSLFPNMQLQIRALPEATARARELGIVVLPAFILDGD